ncbi:helix-turn-helix domain-containing protein [Serratia sp. L9]|uniref:helix-turn-helix domain-containing protein n=1 Tax=Serratia sp. L9 TaxID=3423946 RepID=UPI003D668BC3
MNFSYQISGRLKEERKRLKFNQNDVASLCGVSREMWGKYERGLAMPGANVLAALATAGANVQYVLTGDFSGGTTLSRDEQEMLTYYRAAPLAVRMAALAALTSAQTGRGSISVTGSNNRVAGGDYNEGKK